MRPVKRVRVLSIATLHLLELFLDSFPCQPRTDVSGVERDIGFGTTLNLFWSGHMGNLYCLLMNLPFVALRMNDEWAVHVLPFCYIGIPFAQTSHARRFCQMSASPNFAIASHRFNIKNTAMSGNDRAALASQWLGHKLQPRSNSEGSDGGCNKCLTVAGRVNYEVLQAAAGSVGASRGPGKRFLAS